MLYVVGLGAFYRELKSWLHEHPERQLVILEEDEGVVAAALQKSQPWISDPQVDFVLLPKDRELVYQELAEKYPVKHIEVFGPAKDRLSLLRKTTLAHALFVDRLHGHQPFENFVRNISRLNGGFYANGLKNSFQNVPAIVCGAGPSLQAAIPSLKAGRKSDRHCRRFHARCDERTRLPAPLRCGRRSQSRGISPISEQLLF